MDDDAFLAAGQPSGELDAQELMHLAVAAMTQHRDAEAITLLKRAIALAPRDGRMHYLLGAVHAQIGMTERALEEFRQAVDLAPELDMARFQLGLLELTSSQVEAARQDWEPLQRLPEDAPLRLFVAGLLCLADNDHAGCIRLLQRGMALNAEYEALNRDMARVVELARQRLAETPAVTTLLSPEAEQQQHVLLSGYRRPGA